MDLAFDARTEKVRTSMPYLVSLITRIVFSHCAEQGTRSACTGGNMLTGVDLVNSRLIASFSSLAC